MLLTVKSAEQYKLIYDKYVLARNLSNHTNCFLESEDVLKYIATNRLKYSANEKSLFLFVDYGDYYAMFFVGISSSTGSVPCADKEICCDIFEQKTLAKIEENELYKLFSSQGFVCKQEFEQVRFSYGKLHDKAVSYIANKSLLLQQLGMVTRIVRLQDQLEIETLIASKISKYDKIALTAAEWQEQVTSGNVVGIYKGELLVALYYFNSKGGPIVVKEEYRGNNLSALLRMYFAAQPRWDNSHKNQYDWVGRSNLASKKAFARIDAIYTGKIKYRYIKSK